MRRLRILIVGAWVIGGLLLGAACAWAGVEVEGPAGPLAEGVKYEFRIRNTGPADIELEHSALFVGQFGTLSKESRRSTWSLLETSCPICLGPEVECGQPFRYVGGQPATAEWTVKYRSPCAPDEEEAEEEAHGKKKHVHKGKAKIRIKK